MNVTALVNRHHIDSSGVSFATVSRVFQEGCSLRRGEPCVGGLQYLQLYPGQSVQVDTEGRLTVFGFGTANGAGFLPEMVARQVIPLTLVPAEHLYIKSRDPWPPSN